MYILAFETTGPHCSVALIDRQGNLREAASKGTLNHLQYLMPLTRRLLEECGLQLGDIEAIAVSEGPGSFTGIRIGVSSARGLAQAISCSVIPVPTLKAFAYHMPGAKAWICPIFDARRNQVYGGVFAWQNDQIVEVMPSGPYLLEEFLALLDQRLGEAQTPVDAPSEGGAATTPESLIFYGDGLKNYGGEVAAWAGLQSLPVEFAPEEHRYQEAGSVARLGLDEMKKGKAKDYREVFPNYMRMAEAQRNLEERLAKEKAAAHE